MRTARNLWFEFSAVVVFLGFVSASATAQQPNQQDAFARKRTLPGDELVNPRSPFFANVAVNRRDGIYQEGDSLRVQFQALGRDAHLYLLYHQVDGAVLLLFPNAARPDNRIAAGRRVNVPGADEEFYFRVRKPLGREVLQVLAAKEPLTELDELVRKDGGRAPAVGKEIIGRLQARLKTDASLWAEHRVPVRTIAREQERPDHKPSRMGLFIGIGKYKRDDIGSPHVELRHSAEVMHELMLKRGGLDPNLTKLVTDQEATRSNLEELIFRWLPSVSVPGDTVFIYFSGHAGQTDNISGTEPDDQDETLAPYDIDNGTPDMSVEQRLARLQDTQILDDTLARWIQELQGRQVVLILDTCHSGGVVEGKGLSRFLADETTQVKDIAQLNTIVLTSCAADEEALFDGTPNKTMWFTYYLAKAIEQNQPLTVKGAYEYTRDGMKQTRRRLGEARVQIPTLTDNALLPIKLVP